MTRDAAFFYQIIKPGRYLGGEVGIPRNGASPSAREIVWYYPDRYERAITDSAWRRSYFQVSNQPGVRVSRGVEYARDVWASLESSGKPTFTLDHLSDIRAAACVVFWAPDVLTAAHIPAIMRRSGLANSGVTIGVVCDGAWIPRFLFGHVDWIAPAPDGWLPGELLAYLRDGGFLPACAIPAKNLPSDPATSIDSWRQGQLAASDSGSTPRWVPRVEVEDDYFDVELTRIISNGRISTRDVASVVIDTLDGLKSTGVDGVRFCNSGADDSALTVAALSELQRRHSMKRVRVHLPAITIDQFRNDWLAYKPHILKPMLRLTINDSEDQSVAIETGNRALNIGWQGLTAVLDFDSFEKLLGMLKHVQTILRGWSQAAQGHSDKRPLRIEYSPAPVGQWTNAANEPDDYSVRQFSSDFRQFKDDLSRIAAVGTFRIEDIMVRNWLAATELDIWAGLSGLELSDPNDPESSSFDWFGWLRQGSGMTEPPRSPYLSVNFTSSRATDAQADESAPMPTYPALLAPSENLFGRRKQRAVASNRMVAPPLTRMRVRWAKEMPWRLYSHLDVVRAIERAIRRAGLPASYSEGFHPRLKLSFGPPLAFGLLSETEYFDLLLEEEFQQSDSAKLLRTFPDGLRFEEARGIAAGMPALSDTLNEAIYSAVIPMDLADAEGKLDEFQDREEVSWVRIGREDRRPIDPRKTLRHAIVEEVPEGTRWELSVVLGGEGNIRPTEWAMLLFGFSKEQLANIIITRTGLNIRRGSTVRTPFEPV